MKIKEEEEYNIECQTPGFRKNLDPLFALFPFLIIFGSIIAGLFLRNPLITLIIIFGSLIFYVVLFSYVKRQREEWHATEHKVIFALEDVLNKGEELTLEKIQRTTMYAVLEDRCGEKNKGLTTPSDDKLKKGLELAEYALQLIKDLQSIKN